MERWREGEMARKIEREIKTEREIESERGFANHAPKLLSDMSDMDKPIGMQAASAAVIRAAVSAEGIVVASAWFGVGVRGEGFGAASGEFAGVRV